MSQAKVSRKQWADPSTPARAHSSIARRLRTALSVNGFRVIAWPSSFESPPRFAALQLHYTSLFTRCARLAVVALPKLNLAQGANMADIERINVKQAREKAHQALLVCAYENEAKYRIFNLDGSISLANFRSRLASLPKTQEIIFF
jgi:hypothetical protein